MKLTLIQPPSNYEETFLLSPPLGLLSIASAAESEGASVSLLDFNLKGLQNKAWQTAEYFYPHAVELIEQTNPDIVGFTSMAIESHVCLETARLLKERNPNIITIFGGPHFGAIATEVLEHYEWTDYIISGEGEAPLQNLIRYLEGNESVTTMDNIAYRDNGEIVFNRQSLSGRDLDEIPFPAYHLVDMAEYFALNPNKLVCFEHARGCYLKCSFCYSPQHWGHGESRKSTERVLAEMRQLKEMGIEELFWVSDNLLNSKENTISLCEAITESELQFKWHCYGTLPPITEPVVEALSNAGCQSIFVGVDAVAEDNKKKYKKGYFKGWDGLREKLSLCLRNGITPTCAFMLSPLDTPQTSEQTLRIAALCANLGCFVRLNALTYYNNSEIESSVDDSIREYSGAYAEVLFDTAELLFDNNYGLEQPQLFPFHCTFVEKEAHELFAKLCRIAMNVINRHFDLNLRAMIDYNVSLFATIASVATQFDIDKIFCRKIQSKETQIKYHTLIYGIYLERGVPEIYLKIDILRQKALINKKPIDVNPEFAAIPDGISSMVPRENVLLYKGRENLNLINAEQHIPSKAAMFYVIFLVNSQIKILKIDKEAFQKIENRIFASINSEEQIFSF